MSRPFDLMIKRYSKPSAIGWRVEYLTMRALSFKAWCASRFIDTIDQLRQEAIAAGLCVVCLADSEGRI